MQPTNKSERRKALLNFMLLFLVCSGIIITTVFFSTRIPLKQNNQLLEFKNSVVKRDELKSEFTDKLIIISKMIDELGNKNAAEIASSSSEIENGITGLGKLIPEGNDDDKELYDHVIRNLSYYYEAKKTVKKEIATTANDKQFEVDNARLKAENILYYKELIECRKALPKN